MRRGLNEMTVLSDQLIRIATEYFGPAASTFMSRQCKHLKLNSIEELTFDHLPEYSKYVEISAGLLIGKEKAKLLKEKVLELF